MDNNPFDFQGQPSSRPAEPTDLQRQPNPQMPGAGYQPPPLGDLTGGGTSKLGSLAQSARAKHIKQAKMALLIVGVLYTLVHGFQWMNLDNEMNQERAKAAARGMYIINEAEVYRNAKITCATASLLGIFMIIMGVIVPTSPLPCCISALTLFILAHLGLAFLNPINLLAGIIVKVIVIAALIKAIQAASASEKDKQRAMAMMGSLPSE